MAKKSDITPEYVYSRLDYNPETGVLTWKYCNSRSSKWNSRWAGKEAGTIWKKKNSDYKCIQIRLDGFYFKAHHVAYAIITGKWALITIDHKNRDATDNRWINLRIATKKDQQGNKKVKKRDLPRGVRRARVGPNFTSFITINNKTKYLGTFTCPAAASFAYQIAADIHFGEFARAF